MALLRLLLKIILIFELMVFLLNTVMQFAKIVDWFFKWLKISLPNEIKLDFCKIYQKITKYLYWLKQDNWKIKLF